MVLAIVIRAVPAWAQAPPPESPRVRVTGEATVSVAPDLAEVRILILTEAREANQATGENAKVAARTLSDLKKVVDSGAEVRTASFALDPKYEFRKQGGQTLTGYTAKNFITVKTGRLDSVGKIIDTAVSAGASGVGSIRFTVKDEAPVRREALREAVRNAMDKANEAAAALGLRITRVLRVEEEGARIHVPVIGRKMNLAAAAPSTPVEPGDIEVRASVTLTAEIAPKD
jgi:uncharacterized protein YggE